MIFRAIEFGGGLVIIAGFAAIFVWAYYKGKKKLRQLQREDQES